ncbi:MAG: DUF488 family protein [Azonexus sp.]|nr:DUF488 family protein [Azonexus sp.]
MSISLRRVYEKPAATDGMRILVDRLWPRGLARASAAIDRWQKEIAPSTALRQWFGHDPEKWAEFQSRYRAELLDNPALAELGALARAGHVTLLSATRDEAHCHSRVLKAALENPA